METENTFRVSIDFCQDKNGEFMKRRIFLYITLILIITIHAAGEEEPERSFEIRGYIENSNIVSTYTEQNLPDIFKKNELHSKFDIRYGTDEMYGVIISHQYAISSALNKDYPYSDSLKVSRNGKISNKNYELNFNEAYINATFPVVRVRAGNQIYGWGTADVFNPTSYFNPMDLREFIFKNEDERVSGIPSISAMWFIGDYTLETVFTPVQVASEIQTGNGFWAIKEKKGPFPVIVENPEALAADPENYGYGIRFSGTFFGADASASAYYGPDREPLMRPIRTLIEPDRPVSMLVQPEYRMTAAAGFDISANFDPFVIQGEMSYSPYRYGVIDQPYSADVVLPFKVEKNRTLTYTIGANYFIPMKKLFEWHTGTAVLTAEWMQVINSNDKVIDPLLTDIISTRFEDTFFEDNLKFSITMMRDIKNRGMSVFPKAAWYFQNGLSIEFSYIYIEGDNGSVFGYYNDNDHIGVRCRYAY
jgi:hypothetical protein